MTIASRQAIQNAQNISESKHHSTVKPLHLLDALTQQQGIAESLLAKIGVQKQTIQTAIEHLYKKMPSVHGVEPALDKDFAKVLETARKNAETMKDDYVSAEHLLLAILTTDNTCKKLLNDLGVDENSALQALADIRGNQRVTTENPESTFEALARYARDLTAEAAAQKLDPVIGRNDEIRRTLQVLSRKTKNNPILLGEPGTGKTALVEGLAQRIVKADVPLSLQHKRVLSLDMS